MRPLRRFAFSTVNFTIFISASALAVDSTRNAEFAVKEAKSDACYTWSWRGKNPERRTRRNLTPLDKIEGFAPASDPETDKYGGWTGTNVGNSDGFFRVRKIDGRWWFVDPEGNLFLAKSVASFNPGRSGDEDRVRERLFGPRKEWAEREIAFVKSIGFNSLGAWASPEAMWLASNRIPYTMILSPMATYNHALDKAGKEQELFSRIDRKSGSSFGFPFVFDPGFEATAEKVLSRAAEHKDDPWLIGYFIDNEVQFRITMLEDCLTKWPEGHLNRDSAKAWLDRRKGRRDCTAADIDEADKKAFAAYCIDLYFSKVSRILRKYDKNHLFLGSRFHTWAAEMENPECFKVAGKYLDVVSLNHYRWDLDLKLAQMWERESGKPFMVTEFYAKGADSGLGNTSGAGFVVPTQEDRGLFYQHFAGRLLRSPACVGWTWFTYRDNPANDGNKGIVSWDFKRYEPLVRRMKEFNSCVFNLVKFLDGKALADGDRQLKERGNR